MSKTTPAEIEHWLVVPSETERLEFKEAKTNYDDEKLFRYCVALANEGGGHIVLGVSDKPPRQVVGTLAYPNVNGVANRIFDTLKFRVDVEETYYQDKRLVVFHVPPRPIGTVYRHHGIWMRSTGSLVEMSEDRLRQIFAEGQPNWCALIARSDCDDAQVVELLNTDTYFVLRKRPIPSTRIAALKALAEEGFLVRKPSAWNITNLGAMLFARRLTAFEGLGRKAVRVVVYHGHNKLKPKLDTATGENPFDAGYAVIFKELVEFINAQLPRVQSFDKTLREEIAMFPAITIRELVPNALVHQDFTASGTSVVIQVYSDRVEIMNPGKPIIPIQRFITENKSRNEAFAKAMRLMGVCEEEGSGMQKTIDAIEERQLPAPDFRVGETRTTVVLFGPKPFSQMEKSERVRACFQHCCLRWITNQRMTNQSLRERFGLPNTQAKTTAVYQVIVEAVNQDLIKPLETESTSKRYASYVPSWD